MSVKIDRFQLPIIIIHGEGATLIECLQMAKTKTALSLILSPLPTLEV